MIEKDTNSLSHVLQRLNDLSLCVLVYMNNKMELILMILDKEEGNTCIVVKKSCAFDSRKA